MNGNGHVVNGQTAVMANGVPRTPPSDWVVQKFGGTSVGKFAHQIVEQVIQYVILFSRMIFPTRNAASLLTVIALPRPSTLTNHVAVVCSARSSSSKADGTTNR